MAKSLGLRLMPEVAIVERRVHLNVMVVKELACFEQGLDFEFVFPVEEKIEAIFAEYLVLAESLAADSEDVREILEQHVAQIKADAVAALESFEPP